MRYRKRKVAQPAGLIIGWNPNDSIHDTVHVHELAMSKAFMLGSFGIDT